MAPAFSQVKIKLLGWGGLCGLGVLFWWWVKWSEQFKLFATASFQAVNLYPTPKKLKDYIQDTVKATYA